MMITWTVFSREDIQTLSICNGSCWMHATAMPQKNLRIHLAAGCMIFVGESQCVPATVGCSAFAATYSSTCKPSYGNELCVQPPSCRISEPICYYVLWPAPSIWSLV